MAVLLVLHVEKHEGKQQIQCSLVILQFHHKRQAIGGPWGKRITTFMSFCETMDAFLKLL